MQRAISQVGKYRKANFVTRSYKASPACCENCACSDMGCTGCPDNARTALLSQGDYVSMGADVAADAWANTANAPSPGIIDSITNGISSFFGALTGAVRSPAPPAPPAPPKVVVVSPVTVAKPMLLGLSMTSIVIGGGVLAYMFLYKKGPKSNPARRRRRARRSRR